MIRYEADFDNGSLNISRTVFDGKTITLEPRRFQGEWGKGDFGWFYFKLSGDLDDRKLEFKLPVVGSFNRYHEDQRFVFSYDREKWFFFDNGVVADDNYRFGHNTYFSSKEVFIAYGLPYTFKMVKQHAQRIRRSPWVFPTKSAADDLIVGMTAGSSKGGYRDDVGRDVPALKLIGYKITDPSATGPKKTIVLSGGNHPCETVSNYVLEGMVDFLTGNDPLAAILRRRADFLVYPCTNPEGRYAGYFRSNPENPALDHNRHWKDSKGFTDIRIIKRAMLRDSGGKTDYFIDFHGQMKSLRFEVWVLEEMTNSAFIHALEERVPDLFVRKRPGSSTGCRTWSMSAEDLNSKFSFTPEVPFLPGVFAEDYRFHGKNYGLALSDVLI